MYKYTLMTIALCISSTLFAQPTRIFQFSKPDTTIKTQYSHLRVIDKRTKTDNIGFIKTGPFNRTTDVITDKPVAALLEAYYNQLIPNGATGNNELVLVLYGIKMEDRPINSEMGTFYFDGDFYSYSNGRYTFMGKVDSLFEVSSGFDVTQQVLDAARYVVTDLLIQYATKAADEHAPAMTEEEVLQRRIKANLKYPIYSAKQFKKGIYLTEDNFLNNEPLDTPLAVTYLSKGEYARMTFYYLNAKGKKGERIDEDSYFAIYDGTEWAVSDKKYAVIMTYRDSNFFAARRMKGLANNTGAAVMFGLAGALISSGVKGNGEYKCMFDPEIKDFRPYKRIL